MGSSGTIASSPSLPLELVEEEILCRLPVKILMQLRCICKSWKYLISDDHKFAKKHLRMSKILKHHHLIVFRYHDQILWDSPLSSILSNVSNSTVTQTKLNIPISSPIMRICSCDGILCFTFTLGGEEEGTAVLWNPSHRKYSTLPPLETLRKKECDCLPSYSFGYEHSNDVYKVIAISCFKDKNNKVDVYTLGTNYWRTIQEFPCSPPFMYKPGVFVGGTVNWLAREKVTNVSCCHVIVSLDLEKESYQKISPPDLEKSQLDLGMFRDCLCIFASTNMFLDVWIMKEYGIKESWTKLYNVPYVENQYVSFRMSVYIYDDNQMLFSFYDLKNSKFKLAVYNSKNGNVDIPKIQHISSSMNTHVYVESLISLPCSY